MTAAVWAALLGGALGGSVVTAALNAVTTRATWRREDRHRFAQLKHDAYAEFVAAAERYIVAMLLERHGMGEAEKAESEQRVADLARIQDLLRDSSRETVETMLALNLANGRVQIVGGDERGTTSGHGKHDERVPALECVRAACSGGSWRRHGVEPHSRLIPRFKATAVGNRREPAALRHKRRVNTISSGKRAKRFSRDAPSEC
jgi:hypothetical protein